MTTILVTGGNRGIGLEFVTQFLKLGFSVITTSRKTSKSTELLDLKDHFNNSLEILELDLLSDGSIEKFGELLGSRPIDIFVNNAGVMGPRNLELNQVSSTPWLEVLRVNTIAPLILTKNILPNILSGDEKKMFYLSSRVGSIAENTAGAMYAYRSSKAALNQVVKCLFPPILSDNVCTLNLMLQSIFPWLPQTFCTGAAASDLSRRRSRGVKPQATRISSSVRSMASR